MFKILIAGKTMIELRTNVALFLAGMDDFTVPSERSQEPRSRTATETIAAEKAQFQNPFGAPPPMPNFEAPAPVPTFVASPPPLPTPAPVKPAAPPPNDFGVDSKGLPWDARIHAVTQGVNKDGSWRYRRGVEDAQIERIESELRARGGVTDTYENQVAKAATPPVPEQPYAIPHLGLVPHPLPPPVVASQPPPAPVVPATPSVSVPVQPVAAPVSVAPQLSAHTVDTFKANLVATLAKLVADGRLTNEYVQSIKNYFQVEQIWQVNETQVAEMFESFCKAGLIVKAQ